VKNGYDFLWQSYDDRISQQPGRGTLVITTPRDEDIGQLFSYQVIFTIDCNKCNFLINRSISMFRVQRMGYCDIQLCVCPQIGSEFVQGRTSDDRFSARGFAIQPSLPTARWLAQTVRLLDDAEQQRRSPQH